MDLLIEFFFRAVPALLLVLGLLLAGYVALRWRRSFSFSDSSDIKITRRKALGGKKALLEIVWQGKILLIATDNESIQLLSEQAAPAASQSEPSFETRLAQAHHSTTNVMPTNPATVQTRWHDTNTTRTNSPPVPKTAAEPMTHAAAVRTPSSQPRASRPINPIAGAASVQLNVRERPINSSFSNNPIEAIKAAGPTSYSNQFQPHRPASSSPILSNSTMIPTAQEPAAAPDNIRTPVRPAPIKPIE